MTTAMTTTTTTLSLILLTTVVTSVRQHQSKRTANAPGSDWESGIAASSSTVTGARVRSGGSSSVREFCDWETANATCPGRDELVIGARDTDHYIQLYFAIK